MNYNHTIVVDRPHKMWYALAWPHGERRKRAVTQESQSARGDGQSRRAGVMAPMSYVSGSQQQDQSWNETRKEELAGDVTWLQGVGKLMCGRRGITGRETTYQATTAITNQKLRDAKDNILKQDVGILPDLEDLNLGKIFVPTPSSGEILPGHDILALVST